MMVTVTNTGNVRLERIVVVARAAENEMASEIRKTAKFRNSDSGEPSLDGH